MLQEFFNAIFFSLLILLINVQAYDRGFNDFGPKVLPVAAEVKDSLSSIEWAIVITLLILTLFNGLISCFWLFRDISPWIKKLSERKLIYSSGTEFQVKYGALRQRAGGRAARKVVFEVPTDLLKIPNNQRPVMPQSRSEHIIGKEPELFPIKEHKPTLLQSYKQFDELSFIQEEPVETKSRVRRRSSAKKAKGELLLKAEESIDQLRINDDSIVTQEAEAKVEVKIEKRRASVKDAMDKIRTRKREKEKERSRDESTVLDDSVDIKEEEVSKARLLKTKTVNVKSKKVKEPTSETKVEVSAVSRREGRIRRRRLVGRSGANKASEKRKESEDKAKPHEYGREVKRALRQGKDSGYTELKEEFAAVKGGARRHSESGINRRASSVGDEDDMDVHAKNNRISKITGLSPNLVHHLKKNEDKLFIDRSGMDA